MTDGVYMYDNTNGCSDVRCLPLNILFGGLQYVNRYKLALINDTDVRTCEVTSDRMPFHKRASL